jgi:DnaK suppressor protein
MAGSGWREAVVVRFPELSCYCFAASWGIDPADWCLERPPAVREKDMARKLAKSTIKRFQDQLTSERERLESMIEELEEEREQAKLNETASERNPDIDSVDGGTMAFEYEKELALVENARDLLRKVDNAEVAIKKGKYGVCEECGTSIPIARLQVLPYTTMCVDCSGKR